MLERNEAEMERARSHDNAKREVAFNSYFVIFYIVDLCLLCWVLFNVAFLE